MRSTNWRERAQMPSGPHSQAFAQVSKFRSSFAPPRVPFAGNSNTRQPPPVHPQLVQKASKLASRLASSQFPVSAGRTHQNSGGRRVEPIGVRYGQKVNFYGYVPSSLHRTSNPTLEQVKATHAFQPQLWKIEAERRRANLPTLVPVIDLEEGKYYAQWAGGYVEINDDLIARCICPADLLQHPCPWDEFEGGCQMELEKYTDYRCPDWEGLNPENLAPEDENYESRYDTKKEWERRHESKCPHIHAEVEPSCRFVASFRKCTIVLDKAYDCAVGHDLEAARQVSRSRFEAHVLDALHAGATRVVPREGSKVNTKESTKVNTKENTKVNTKPRLLPPPPFMMILQSPPIYRPVEAATRGVSNGRFLHHLPLFSPTALDLAHPDRFFIPYQNLGYLEVRKELIERICPADLCGKECPFNNIFYWEEATGSGNGPRQGSSGMWRFGCRLLRLCECVQAHPFRPPPPMPFPIYQMSARASMAARGAASAQAGSHAGGAHGPAITAGKLRKRIFRLSERGGPENPMVLMCKVPVEHPDHVKACPFIHKVERTCRYVLRKNKDGVQHCSNVLNVQGGGCEYGHDFEQERIAALGRLREHRRDAEEWKELPGVAWRNDKGGWMGLDESSMVFEADEAEG
ncbi:hypothetical protein DV738_g4258, partial [Chaetothyriales sp. CBS 135597]